jgi:type VI secretion system (T6SS) effector Tae4 (amidase)
MPIQMVPSLEALLSRYPTMIETLYPEDNTENIARQMGFEPPKLAEIVKLWANTCAICMSYCLLQCGIVLGKEPRRGSETVIPAGPQKGKNYWMTQHNLSNHLLKDVFGKPTYHGGVTEDLVNQIGAGGGVISFYSMTGYDGGHTDIVYPDHDGRLLLRHYPANNPATFLDYASRTADIRFWRTLTGGT